VLVDFQIITASILPSNVKVTPSNQCSDCPSCGCTFSAFYIGSPSQQINTYVLSANNGYILRLIDLGSNHYQIEIINKPEPSGLWNQGTSVDEWIVDITGLPGTGYKFSLLSIVAKNLSNVDVIDTNLQFTYVSPCNVKPTVAGITPTISATAPLAVRFSANTPNDIDGTIDHYLWSFGGATTDGLLTEDRTNNLPFTKTYTADGSYTVTLQVRDNDGALSDSIPATPAVDDPVTTTVNTNQRPLVTGIYATISTTTALAVQFSANMPAIPDPDTGDTIVDYIWDFGGATTDGLSTETKHNNTPFTKTYTADGSYAVTLRVVDDNGLSSDSNTLTPEEDPVSTTVNTNQRPLVSGINATLSTTTALAVQFSATGVSDPDADDMITDYVWDFGGATTDGLTTETKHNNTPFTKTYTADGSYPVTLRVTDDKGLSSYSRDTVLILVAEPTFLYKFNDNSFTIYPVPAKDVVYVEYRDKAGDNKITVQLYDLYGKLVLTDIRYEKNNVAIDVSGMPTGIYCLTVHCGNGTKTYKIPKL
jgi:PKD repeat protein